MLDNQLKEKNAGEYMRFLIWGRRAARVGCVGAIAALAAMPPFVVAALLDYLTVAAALGFFVFLASLTLWGAFIRINQLERRERERQEKRFGGQVNKFLRDRQAEG